VGTLSILGDFTILTRRHPARAAMFNRCLASVEAQSCERIRHHVFPPAPRTLEEANGVIADASTDPAVYGRAGYVYVLDDDDELVDPGFAVTINTEAHVRCARPWYMVAADLGPPLGAIFPRPWGDDWGPRFGNVSSLNLVVRIDVFRAHGAAWAGGRGGDFRFAQAMWDAGLRPEWLDFVAARTQRISGGRGEDE
jgi:hypothetical protein